MFALSLYPEADNNQKKNFNGRHDWHRMIEGGRAPCHTERLILQRCKYQVQLSMTRV
jgi:hypothetical protein